MRRFVALSVFLGGLIGAAPTFAGEWYRHNNSYVEVSKSANSTGGLDIRITYTNPDPGIRNAGAEAGTLLFSGFSSQDGEKVAGTAYVFKKGCPPAPYAVTGSFSGRALMLTGPSPIRESGGCDVVSNSESSRNARLRFEPAN